MAANPNIEGEADDVYDGILGEIGMEGANQMGQGVGSKGIAATNQQPVAVANQEELDKMAA